MPVKTATIRRCRAGKEIEWDTVDDGLVSHHLEDGTLCHDGPDLATGDPEDTFDEL